MEKLYRGKGWIRQGLGWALMMYLVLVIALPYFEGKPYSTKGLLIDAIVWVLLGLSYGYCMKLYYAWQSKKQEK
ncbi:MAG TPA: hypothetical protein VL021_03710 [Brumimicrobium sp.]|nr:hypothetical protein [Brumimicrobium sp.]